MARRAQLDPDLAVRVLAERALRYDAPARPHDDRPTHVRAASGLAVQAGRLVVVQDDAHFLAVVSPGEVAALHLPRGRAGRRRFEVALGNKLDKLDLESCVAIDDALWAFGSGSLPARERVCVVEHGVARVREAGPLFRVLRQALGHAVNVEGAARLGDELWLFHRGNTGPEDRGPAVARLPLPALRTWLAAEGALPALIGVDAYDLGAIAGQPLGFTDAVARGDRVYYLASAEASPDAIDDGAVLGSQLGVITLDGAVRAAPLAGPDGAPVKAEGLAFADATGPRVWIALDPDDPEQPAVLLEAELVGAW